MYIDISLSLYIYIYIYVNLYMTGVPGAVAFGKVQYKILGQGDQHGFHFLVYMTKRSMDALGAMRCNDSIRM